MVSSRASTADCATSVSTSTCSPISTRRDRSSKNGGSTTTRTDHTRASTGSHRLSSQHAPHRGITGTDSPYERGQFGEQVINFEHSDSILLDRQVAYFEYTSDLLEYLHMEMQKRQGAVSSHDRKVPAAIEQPPLCSPPYPRISQTMT